MKNIIANAARFVRDEDGVTAIEYALIASIIALGIITAVTGLKTALVGVFNNLASSV
jgi:pilus assembly protein Flp/PilA